MWKKVAKSLKILLTVKKTIKLLQQFYQMRNAFVIKFLFNIKVHPVS